MSQVQDSAQSIPTVNYRRPVGIWIATIWAGLFAGLLPLAFVLIFYFGPAKGWEFISVGQLVVSVAISLGVVASSVGAWLGFPRARYSLAILVVIHYGLVAYQNYQMAAAGIPVRGSTAIPWGRVVRSLITASAIAGYLLLSKNAQAFFNRMRQPRAV